MPLNRTLSGDPLVLDLKQEETAARAEHRDGHGGRYARTLIKDGPIRVTLIAMDNAATIPQHSSDGPITVQVLSGAIRFRTTDSEHILLPGSLLALAGGVRHDVAADEDSIFLLTVAMSQSIG